MLMCYGDSLSLLMTSPAHLPPAWDIYGYTAYSGPRTRTNTPASVSQALEDASGANHLSIHLVARFFGLGFGLVWFLWHQNSYHNGLQINYSTHFHFPT